MTFRRHPAATSSRRHIIPSSRRDRDITQRGLTGHAYVHSLRNARGGTSAGAVADGRAQGDAVMALRDQAACFLLPGRACLHRKPGNAGTPGMEDTLWRMLPP